MSPRACIPKSAASQGPDHVHRRTSAADVDPVSPKYSRASHRKVNVNRRGLTAGAVIVLAICALLVGAASATLAAVSATQSQSGSPRVGRVINRIDLPGPVYDLAVNSSGTTLWFAFMSPGSDSALYRYDITSGAMSHWSLPSTDYNGFVSRVAIAPDGGVWLTEDYNIVRFDPTTAAMSVKTLPLADVDATSTAFAFDVSAGTWPCAITFDSSGHAIVARHNVNSLLLLDQAMDESGRIQIPLSPHGPGDVLEVGGLIYVDPDMGVGPAFVVDERGNKISTQAKGGYRLAAVGSEVVSTGAAGLTWLTQSGAGSQLSDEGSTLSDLVAGGPSGVVRYLSGPNRLERVQSSGTVSATFALTAVPAQVRDPSGNNVTESEGHMVGALAVDSADTVWFIDLFGSSTSLVHIAL